MARSWLLKALCLAVAGYSLGHSLDFLAPAPVTVATATSGPEELQR